MSAGSFEENVFVNCPFDDVYRHLLKALVFTVLDCGLEPRLATESADSGQVRIAKINRLIRSSRLSIHDISRIEPLHAGDLPRFNMPFELGLDLGCRTFGGRTFSKKQCLILEKERYRYQRVLSDISGNDIRAHGGESQTLISEVRNWIKVVDRQKIPGGNRIWLRFNEFMGHLDRELERLDYTDEDIDGIEPVELIEYAREWILGHPAT